MTVFMICLFLLIIVPMIFFIRDWYVKAKLQRLVAMKYYAMKNILRNISSASNISEEEIDAIARIPSLRIELYRALELYGYVDQFPKEWYTEESGAESYLVNWLEFPTELGRSPDEISMMKIVTIEFHLHLYYYVFKFRTSAPKWANKFGWMMGVCGPYNNNSLPFDIPFKVYSRFNPVRDITPDAEVKWVHENINV